MGRKELRRLVGGRPQDDKPVTDEDFGTGEANNLNDRTGKRTGSLRCAIKCSPNRHQENPAVGQLADRADYTSQ